MKIIKLKLSVTNCYLIKNDSKYVLIDTGYECDFDMFKKKLSEENVSISQISHVILTHHHDDHVGFINKIVDENKNIHVVMSPLCRDLIAKGENDMTHGGGYVNGMIKFLIRFKRIKVMLSSGKHVDKSSNLKFQPYYARKEDIIVEDGTKLKDIGINLNGRIIATPGHTVDSMSIIFDDGSCIVGDAAANMLQFAGTRYCVIFICNLDEYYKSWEKIISSGAVKIYPGHGKPFSADKLKQNIWKNKKDNMAFK